MQRLIRKTRAMWSKRTCPSFEAALQPHPTRNKYTLLLIVTFLHLYSMPGPRIEPQITTYKADDVLTGHRDKHYTTSLPTTIMINQTHADIHQMVSKPMRISHVYAIRPFKQSMCGVDRVHQNVGKCICRIGSKNLWRPLLPYFLDIYIMCNRRHICIVPCHRERIVPKTCQPPGEIPPRYCTRRLPESRQWETEERVCRAIAKHQS